MESEKVGEGDYYPGGPKMVFDLVVKPSALELPSLNPGDTTAIALMKFSGIPVNVVPRAQMNPKIAPIDTRVLLTEGIVDDTG